MTNDTLLIRFGGLTFGFHGRIPPIASDSLLPKFVVQGQNADVWVEIMCESSVEIPPSAKTLLHGSSIRVRQDGDRVWLSCCSLDGASLWTYAVMHVDLQNLQKMRLQILQPDCKLTMDHVLSVMLMESHFLAHGCAIFHASVVAYCGQAILFTAPSGVGKSTQAALWQRHRDAVICNGDKVLLRSENGVELACGLPFAGTSGIGEAFELPIRAIVILSQAEENRLESVPALPAVQMLLSQICLQKWRTQDIEAALNVAQRLQERVPIFHLACLPDESAVSCLERELKK